MAYTTPATYSTNQTLTASNLNTYVRDNVVWLATDAPLCRVYNSSAISLTNATATALTFDSERFDVGGCHSTSVNTGRITVPTGAGGKWHIGAHIEFASNSTGYRYVGIRVNGTTVIAYQTTNALNGLATLVSLSTMYAASAGDYFEVLAFQNSGGALNATSTSAYAPEFWAEWRRT